MPFYQQVAKTTKLRMLVYNGDADPSINSFVAQNWTSHLGFTPAQTWRPWTLDGCLRMGTPLAMHRLATSPRQRCDFPCPSPCPWPCPSSIVARTQEAT